MSFVREGVRFALLVVLRAMPGIDLCAAEYYVDAVNGNDNWDGSCAERVGETTSGPRQTLAGILSLATAQGDVVYALPGVYSNGTMSANGLNRAVIGPYVTLRSTEGPEKTIIMGEADPEIPLYDGCGTNSVRGVYVQNYARLSGFTITEGHAQYQSSAKYEQGGGVMAQSCNLMPAKIGVIDNCIISNNVAYQSGGCRFGGYVGCSIVDNRATSQGYSAISANREAFLYDCYVRSAGWAADFSYAYNTTFDCTIHGKWGGNLCKNCVIPGSILNYMGSESSPGCSNCVLVSTLESGHRKYCDSDCLFMTREAMKIDADGRPQKGSPLIGIGRPEYHVTAPYPVALGGESVIDAAGGQRVYNGMLDIGGFEYDWRGDYSEALDPLGDVEVTNASENVTLKDAGTVMLGGPAALALTWKPRTGASADYRFHAHVTGTGTLTVTKDGAVWRTLTAADGDVGLSVTKEGVLGLAFAYAAGTDDEGGAELYEFTNVSYANITVADGGVVLEGATAGMNYVPTGGSLTITATRTFDRADSVCKGISSNGVFYAFDDFPDGLTFTVTDTLRDNLVLAAVYDDAAATTWYVDAEGGDDDRNYGHHPENAFKTLATVLARATVSGDVVWALPGVYTNGTMTTIEGDKTVLNRAVVAAGVTLRSAAGADKTIIKGAASALKDGWSGCGTDSVRGVYLNLTARLEGFTVTGCQAFSDVVSGGKSGGGIYCSACSRNKAKAPVVEDCVVSNNTAFLGGGGFNGIWARCRVEDNTSSYGSGLAGWNELMIYDSRLNNNHGAYQIDSAAEAVNVTIGPNGDSAYRFSGGVTCNLYDALILAAPGNYSVVQCHNCVFLDTIPNVTNNIAAYDNCHILSAAEIDVSADGHLGKGSWLIDAGLADRASLLPARVTPGGDAYGTQRVYNGTIDIGGVEYDWRGDYSADMGRYVSVSNATAGVIEADGKVRLTDGESILIEVDGSTGQPYRLGIAIEGAGALTVRRGELVVATLTASDTVWEFKLMSKRDAIDFSYAGEGIADLGKVQSGLGMLLIFR